MRAPPICRYRAGWERFLRSLPRLASVPTGSANIQPPLSPTIDCQIRYGLAVATIMALRGPTTAARITAGPPFLTAAACPMSAAYTAIAETRQRNAGEMLSHSLKQRDLGRDVMAGDFPIACFPNNDPGQLDRERRSAFADDERRRAGDVDQIRTYWGGHEIGELNAGRTPSRQRVEIGCHTFVAAIKFRVRAVKECVLRV